MTRCTCTIACIPQGLVGEQECRLGQQPLPLTFSRTQEATKADARAEVVEVQESQGEGTETVVLGFRQCEDCCYDLCWQTMLCRKEVLSNGESS